MGWRADALESRCAGGLDERNGQSLRQCDGTWFRLGAPPHHRFASTHTDMLIFAALLRLRHWKKPPRNSDSQMFHVEHMPASPHR